MLFRYSYEGLFKITRQWSFAAGEMSGVKKYYLFMTAILRTADTTCRQAGTGTLPQAHRGQETDTRHNRTAKG